MNADKKTEIRVYLRPKIFANSITDRNSHRWRALLKMILKAEDSPPAAWYNDRTPF